MRNLATLTILSLWCGSVTVATAAPAEPVVTEPAVGAAPVARATLLHVPVAEAPPSRAIDLVAVIDGAWAEPALVARFRPQTGGAWREATFERSSAGGWYATIPADAVVPPGAEYYIVGRGPAGEALHFGSEAAPQSVRIEPSVTQRLASLDRVRTGGRTETVSFDLDGHDFGNRYGGRDRFVRSELRWTHRISRELHSVGFGFGVIQGRTPDREGAVADDLVTAGRYGLAEVTLRPHRSLFVDARLTLGVSHEGFLRGIGAAITFGQPWRSNVSIGGEALDDLGPTGYVRLQWDTAKPFLMGASIVRSDLPGAVLDAAGLYLKYDLTYRMDRVAVRAALSYGARDGGAHLGGGVGVETSF